MKLFSGISAFCERHSAAFSVLSICVGCVAIFTGQYRDGFLLLGCACLIWALTRAIRFLD
jgi:hypothetical protein